LRNLPDFAHFHFGQDPASQVGQQQPERGHGGRVRDDERSLWQVATITSEFLPINNLTVIYDGTMRKIHFLKFCENTLYCIMSTFRKY
jgi:hypothetical protein